MKALFLGAALRLARFSRGSEYAQHGADWTMGRCGSRTAQSPINFDRVGAPPGPTTFAFEYKPISELSLQEDDGGWFADLPPFGEVSWSGERYALNELRIHAGSEHTFAGERRAVEIVLRHDLIDESGMREARTLFLSFTLTSPHEVGAEEAPAVHESAEDISDTDADYQAGLELLINTIPLPAPPPKRFVPNPDMVDAAPALLQRNATNGSNATNVTSEEPDIVLDMAPLIQSGAPDLAFFAYEGSSTRPPCGSAQWLVKRAPVRVSSAQLAHLLRATGAAVPNNWRTVMPVGFDRRVEVVSPTDGLPPKRPQPGPYRLPSGPNPRNDGELRAIWQANTARDAAVGLGDLVADLDRRVQRAAVAHRQAFAPTTLAPVDWGFGRLNAQDALKVAETISQSGNALAWDLAHQIQSMHGAIDNAAKVSANVTATRIGEEVKAWYLATPPPPPPPKPTPCPTACSVDDDCPTGSCEAGLCCVTCTPAPKGKKGIGVFKKGKGPSDLPSEEALEEALREPNATVLTGTTTTTAALPTTGPGLATTAGVAATTVPATTVSVTTQGPTTPGAPGTTAAPKGTTAPATSGPYATTGPPTTPYGTSAPYGTTMAPR